MTLPEAFINDIKPYLTAEELAAFEHALTQTDPTCCIRYNRAKSQEPVCQPIAWNPADGSYLAERPNFTLDPLMHAGCYYVQEASSQFVTHLVRQLVTEPVTALDLCAAPGGKSTALLSVLPAGSQLVSNEIDHRRARILAENVTKWGNPNVTVTGNAPSDFTSLRSMFDMVLTDVPCSGEGMFRKDEGAVNDWSPQKVAGCVALQREILRDIWPTLKPGGILIYGTCTYNVHEDEEMLAYICEELGGEAISVEVPEEWHIHQPLKGSRPCYRFMPHTTQGEGLFMAAVRKVGKNETLRNEDENDRMGQHKPSKASKVIKTAKRDDRSKAKTTQVDIKALTHQVTTQLDGPVRIVVTPEGTVRAIPESHYAIYEAMTAQGLFVLQSGIEMGTIKGRDLVPAHALAMSTMRAASAYPTTEVDLETALNYLRHEAIVLPNDVPVGYNIVCYNGHPLGFVKNLGNRSNNLYPQEWRIRRL